MLGGHPTDGALFGVSQNYPIHGAQLHPVKACCSLSLEGSAALAENGQNYLQCVCVIDINRI